jgi:bis(5'-nucleosyl)-tetraphosphatase (symmetrical)
MILRLRYVDNNGDFIAKGKQDKNSSFWADVYDGHEGFVIHGHRWDKQVNFHKNAIGIDTGCVYGHHLSAIVMKDKNNYKIVQQEGYKN